MNKIFFPSRINEKKMQVIAGVLLLAVLTVGLIYVLSMANNTPLSECRVEVEENTFNYTGSEIKPKIVITHGNYTLKKDEDYEIKYRHNTDPGKASITIAGRGDYRGFFRKTFRINVDPVKDLNAEYVNAKEAKGSPFINISWAESEACDYYVVSYAHTDDKKAKSDTIRVETTEPAYRLEGAKTDGEYSISVAAVAGRKKVASVSENTSVIIDPLKKPVLTQASSPGAGRIDVIWEPVENAQNYVVKEISESNGDVYEVTIPAEATSASFLGKIFGNSYTYTVTATATIKGNEYASPVSDSKTASPAKPKVGQATRGDGGRLRGGKAGDQSGSECDISKWNYSSKSGRFNNWKYLLRFKDDAKAIKAAESMIAACNNNNIGYDQSPGGGRGELKKAAANVEWDMAAITVKCETSCSPLVGACVSCTGIEFPAPGSTSNSDFLNPLKNTGEFEVITDSKYLSSNKYLQQGDILVSPGKHTCMVI